MDNPTMCQEPCICGSLSLLLQKNLCHCLLFLAEADLTRVNNIGVRIVILKILMIEQPKDLAHATLKV